MAIEEFKGEYHFLSNMYVLDPGILPEPGAQLVPTVEHAYQGSKFVELETRLLVYATPTGHLAKRKSRELQQEGGLIVPNWDAIKVEIMRRHVREKFRTHPELLKRLLETGEDCIVEGNNWGDRFWGVTPVGTRKGQNWLGRILMGVRQEFRSLPAEEDRQ